MLVLLIIANLVAIVSVLALFLWLPNLLVISIITIFGTLDLVVSLVVLVSHRKYHDSEYACDDNSCCPAARTSTPSSRRTTCAMLRRHFAALSTHRS